MSEGKFTGTKKGFVRYIGAFSRNLVQNITRDHKHNIGRCQHCGVIDRELDSAHIHGKERSAIIEDILSKHIKGEDVVIDLRTFEYEFRSAHDPIEAVILVLCKGCHIAYDRTESAEVIKTVKEAGKDKIPIGRYVREVMFEIWNSGLLTNDELEKLQLSDYSKEMFGINFKFLIKDSRSRFDRNGVARYYKDQIIPGYWMTSQWYERHREQFKIWVKSIIDDI
ncbi:hypothetical protein N9N25_01420 [Schleiferiaceae bacterium]|nr:hypothetical protein [Schleiferiaceae bacterium]